MINLSIRGFRGTLAYVGRARKFLCQSKNNHIQHFGPNPLIISQIYNVCSTSRNARTLLQLIFLNTICSEPMVSLLDHSIFRYLTIFLKVKTSIKELGAQSSKSTDEYALAKKLAIIVVTDFLCWVG